MPSEIPRYAVVFQLLFNCGLILWILFDEVWSLFDRVKKRLSPPKKIFICADCWLLVFDFLAPSQLGLGIALISRRFDLRVDEHFKTRKWMLNKQLKIQWDIKENGTKEMQIVNSDGEALPIPQKPLPNKVIGFSKCIQITYIDQNVLTFLGHFHRFFATSAMDLDIVTENDRNLEFVLHNIWPVFRDSIRRLFLNATTFHRMCQLDSSMLRDCTALHYVSFNDDDILPEFPIDDNANPSDGQVLAKWLFTPRPDGLPKWLKCSVNSPVDQWSSTIEQLQTAFSNASSPVTFRIFLTLSSILIDSVMPFDLINEVTGEQLELQQYGTNDFRLSRCPIGWDKMKWDNVWNELSAARPKRISIRIRDGGLLDAASPGPSDH